MSSKGHNALEPLLQREITGITSWFKTEVPVLPDHPKITDKEKFFSPSFPAGKQKH